MTRNTAGCLLLGIMLSIIHSAPVARAQKHAVMVDPLFAISYDPVKVKFGALPTRIVSQCPELRSTYVKAWVYGHLKSADAEYLLVSGLVHHHDQDTGAPTSFGPEDMGGLAIAVRGSKCLIDQADYFLTQKVNPAKDATPIVVPKKVVNSILQDAFARYAQAFGGKQEFLQLVHPNAIGPPIVREQLALYEKDSTDGATR